MKISLKKNDGFHVRDAFEAAQKEPGPWCLDRSSLQDTVYSDTPKRSCWSRFVPPLQCNPMLRIEAYPPSEVLNPMSETDSVIAPKTRTMLMRDLPPPNNDFKLHFEFMLSDETPDIDPSKHFLVLQVTDDQTETTGDSERVIAECLLTLIGSPYIRYSIPYHINSVSNHVIQCMFLSQVLIRSVTVQIGVKFLFTSVWRVIHVVICDLVDCYEI